MAEAGVARAIFLFILRCYKDGQIDGLDHALRILQLTWTPSAENQKVLEDNYLDKFVNSVLWILNADVESAVKALALVNLKSFTEIVSSVHLERLNSSFFTEIVKVLRENKISPLATKSALQILIETSPYGRNRMKIVEAGAVFELIEMELARPPEKRTTELIFCLLAQLCSCADGRQRLLGHAAGVAVAAKRLLRVSPATDDRIMCVMESVARFAATPAVVVEMLRVGGVSKLCMVLQADCAVYLKKKAREILRLHSSDWSNSPCIQVYLLTRYDR
ncbi:E3 ubiquitin-protein ligase pub24 [Phtheirospermum japonicum]|uniref:U-box domain-containing protein n=1 Tax=Phtheirospermum japonicum TaxID=374723 RepID=A0A830CU70_9LAMI|nr:E3 ubiquitin-protein ligase pub24 [Phtheirospermum japonicum]